jgi:hypothetical protein
VILGPFFDSPVYPADTPRKVGRYRVTNHFDGPDLVNGGKHEATDVGNASSGHPVFAPADCRARGLINYSATGTDALGVEFDLGDVSIELWHLSETLPVVNQNLAPGLTSWGPWQNVTKGQQVGRTGNTGSLVNGGPMPAHTHIRAERDGVPFDIEPHLFGLPLGDDMRYAGWVEHIANRRTTVKANETNLRSAPSTRSASLGKYAAGRSVVPHEKVNGEKLGGDPTWYLVTMPHGTERVVGFFHASVLGPLESTDKTVTELTETVSRYGTTLKKIGEMVKQATG